MSVPSLLDKTYTVILRQMIETGQAPHYTEAAKSLGIGIEEARQAYHDLMAAGVPGLWLFPETDYISSFAPFSNLPTQYRLTVAGEPKWFAQCGFEALAVSWLFPGKTVQIDAPCLDCGELLQVAMQDGTITKTEPAGIMAYVAVPFAKWLARLPFA
jgi:hypothetical protein